MINNNHKNPKGRPLKGLKKRLRTSFTLPPEQIEWLKERSLRLGMSQSDFLSNVISQSQCVIPDLSDLVQSRLAISQKTLAQICKKNQITKLAVFGSILTEQFNPQSDIDILIEFRADYHPTLLDIGRIEETLSPFFEGRKLDVKLASELSRYFREDILNHAEVLYAA